MDNKCYQQTENNQHSVDKISQLIYKTLRAVIRLF